MGDSPLGFTSVPHQDGTLSHHCELASLPVNFSSPLSPFWWEDEGLGYTRKIIDIFVFQFVDLSIFVLYLKDNCVYTLGFGYTYNPIYLCGVGWFRGHVIYVEFNVGVDGFLSP